MSRKSVFQAVGLIDEKYVAEALRYAPAHTRSAPERIVHMKAKRIIALALAATLLLSLGIAAYATYLEIETPEAAEKVALEQVAVWRELGLLNSAVEFEGKADQIVEIEEEQGGSTWYGRLFRHSYDVRWYMARQWMGEAEPKYGCNLNIDTLSGKIQTATLFALPDAEDQSVGETTLEMGEGKEEVWYYYDNFDDIIPADMTVDRFCTLLAAYWGFSGYRLAGKGDPVYTEDYASYYGAVDTSTRLLDIPWDLGGTCFLAVYFDGDSDEAPMYLNLMQFPGYVGITIGARHPVG